MKITISIPPKEEWSDKELVRFWSKVDVGGEGCCWEWKGATTDVGYGSFAFRGRMVGAHRIAYVLSTSGEQGLPFDHLCRNRRCVNPKHLEPVTHRENILRGTAVSAINSRKTSCKRGHPLTADNTYITTKTKSGEVHRRCRACNLMRLKSRYMSKRHVSSRRFVQIDLFPVD